MYGPPPPIHSDNMRPQMPKGFKNRILFSMQCVKNMLKRLLYIYKLVWECKPFLMFIMAFMAIFNGLQVLVNAYLSKLLLDGLQQAVQGELNNFWSLGSLLLLQILFQLIILIVNSVSNIITRLSNELLTNSIKLKIMNKAKTIDMANFDLPSFYSKLENANREAGNRPIQVLQASFTIISTFISLIGFIAVLGSEMWYAPLFVIMVTLPSAIITYRYRKKMFSYVRRRSKDRREMDYYANLLVDKDLVKEVKLFDLSDTFIGKYKQIFTNYFKGLKSLIMAEGIWGIILAFANAIVNGGIFLNIAKNVFDGRLSIGDYSLYTNALFSISNNVSSLISTTASIYEGTLFIDNMIEFMETEPKLTASLPQPLHIAHHIPHEIIFKNVSFCYPGTNRFVLKNINLTLNPGETIVLVGLNGAGKTTLLKLLTRLYDPTEGSIYLDGHDLKEYDVKELYSIFGIIFQDFGKYAFTIRENIGFGEKSRMENLQDIQSAAEKSSAHEFITKLKKGYQTPLMRIFEEDGLELSIGQWQKISVARAFFRNSDIIILDEPTASLDAMAEQEIFSQFESLSKGKTTIFVSHRLSSATMASKIVVLEYGEIVEEGTHKQLIEKNGKYAELFHTQAQRYINT